MSFNFEMIGKLGLGRETDKFKPYSENKYDSGWVRRRIVFNAICGDNRHSLQVDGGCFEDGHGFVYAFTKPSVDENGNRTKGEPIQIPFKDRMKQSNIDKVAEFRKFIFDLEEPGKRRELQAAINKVKEGSSLTDEELEKLGVSSESKLTEALEKSVKKRREFLSEYDFVEFIKKVIDSGKYTDKKFLIRGNGTYSYSDQNERVYSNLVPQRIYLAADDAEEKSTATITKFFFGNESVDEMSVEEKGKYYINGWMMEYDSNRRENIPVETCVVVPVNEEKPELAKKIVEKVFACDDDKIREIGLEINMLNGAQRKEISDEDLTEEQRENLEFGLITMDDIRRELGAVYGDRVQEYQLVKLARGWSKGSEETAYTAEDMVIKPIVNEELDDDLDGLFDDDEL